MKKLLVLLIGFCPLGLLAQLIKGSVTNHLNEPLVGATVFLLDKQKGVTTDAQGKFELSLPNDSKVVIIATYIGYIPDTLVYLHQPMLTFKLQPKPTLNEVIVKGEQDGVMLSDFKAIKTEQITQLELKKAACCDLAGCFETQTTVQPQTTNVITNAKELRILGLSGVYNQILLDGFPMIQGLSYTYGISSIPGPLVDNIYVSKGANSVLQGFESISGQINVETKEPDKTDKLLLNLYANNFAEKHLNALYTFKQRKWSNLTAFHSVQPARKIDRDQDNFLDLPLLTRYMLFNKWKYGNEKNWGWHSRIGVRFLNEQRIGGQMLFDPSKDKGSSSIYGQTVNIYQPEVWTKTGFRLNDQHHIVLFASTFWQQQQSYFGNLRYHAQQQNVYANLQYEFNYQKHDVKLGMSYRQLRLHEDISILGNTLGRDFQGPYHREEYIPGVFVENTLRPGKGKLTWLLGFRADKHQQFGYQYTPRTLIKYDLAPNTIVRANIGSGWRTVNLFSENTMLLVSSRNIVFEEALAPEKAANMGINLTQKYSYFKNQLSGYLSIDFYRTQFQNQIFPDYDSHPQKAIIKNYRGTSISNGFQAELLIKWFNTLELKAGYNFLEVYRANQDVKELLPFNPRHKVIGTFSYKPVSNKFHFDMNLHWYGQQRLPSTRLNPTEFQRPDFSNPYTIVNAQFTYVLKRFEVYTGCENIFDFRQLQPIIGWQNPFSTYFDTSSVWGPTRGREWYLGIRFKLSHP